MVDIQAEAKAKSARLLIDELGEAFQEHMLRHGLEIVLEDPDRILRKGVLADELLLVAANKGLTNREFINKANELRIALNDTLTHGECSKLICITMGWPSRTAAINARKEYAAAQGFDEDDEGFYPNYWHESKKEVNREELKLKKPIKGREAVDLYRGPLQTLLDMPVPEGYECPTSRHHDYSSVLGMLYVIATQETLVRRHADQMARRIRKASNNLLCMGVGYHLIAMALGYSNWNDVLASQEDDCFPNKRFA